MTMIVDVTKFNFSKAEHKFYPEIIEALKSSVIRNKRVWVLMATTPDGADDGIRDSNSGFLDGWIVPSYYGGRPLIQVNKNSKAWPLDLALIVQIELASGAHEVLWRHPNFQPTPTP